MGISSYQRTTTASTRALSSLKPVWSCVSDIDFLFIMLNRFKQTMCQNTWETRVWWLISLTELYLIKTKCKISYLYIYLSSRECVIWEDKTRNSFQTFIQTIFILFNEICAGSLRIISSKLSSPLSAWKSTAYSFFQLYLGYLEISRMV